MKKLFGMIVLGLFLICGSIATAAEVTITWEGSQYADGYEVYHKTLPTAKYVDVVDVENVLEYKIDIDSLNDDVRHYFILKAYNQYGKSPFSAEVSGVIEGTHLKEATPLLGLLTIVYPDSKTVIIDLQKNIITTTMPDGEVSTIKIN